MAPGESTLKTESSSASLASLCSTEALLLFLLLRRVLLLLSMTCSKLKTEEEAWRRRDMSRASEASEASEAPGLVAMDGCGGGGVATSSAMRSTSWSSRWRLRCVDGAAGTAGAEIISALDVVLCSDERQFRTADHTCTHPRRRGRRRSRKSRRSRRRSRRKSACNIIKFIRYLFIYR